MKAQHTQTLNKIKHSKNKGAFFYLSHLASVEEVLDYQKIQFLLRVVLGVLVTDSVNAQDLCQRRRSLAHRRHCFTLKSVHGQ